MSGTDTEIGGFDRSFRTTIWSDILAAGDPSHPESRARVEKLIQAYWKPVYAYLRAAWHASSEDAKDHTQAFFAKLVEKETWSLIRQERGSFRAYLRTALKHFMINARESEAIRRPRTALFSLDASDQELDSLSPESPDEGPDQLYEREWVRCVVTSSIQDLEAFLQREGKARYIDVFRAYCLDSSNGADPMSNRESEPSYREIAERLGLHHSDVRHYLAYCRAELRRFVRARVRDYVSSDEEAERELKEAFGL